MTNLIAIAPKDGKIARFLTNGKEYPIIEWHKKTQELKDWFYITDDDGDKILCVPEGDWDLNGLNWTIKEATTDTEKNEFT